MKITVQNRPSYGKDRIYPVNGLAKSLLVFVGRKTYAHHEITMLEGLGFEIEYQPTSDPAKPTSEAGEGENNGR